MSENDPQAEIAGSFEKTTGLLPGEGPGSWRLEVVGIDF